MRDPTKGDSSPDNIHTKPLDQISTYSRENPKPAVPEAELMNSQPPVNKYKGNVAKLAASFEGGNIDYLNGQMRSRTNTSDQHRLHHRVHDRNRKERLSICSCEVSNPSNPMSAKTYSPSQTSDKDNPAFTVRLDIENHRDNYNTQNQSEEFFSDMDFNKGCEICGQADEDSVNAVFCTDCRQILCLNCLDRHNKCNSTKDHKTIDKHALFNRKENTPSMEYMSDEYRSTLKTHSSEKDQPFADTYYKTPVQFCELCDSNRKVHYIHEASVLCYQCDKNLCNECLFIHHGDKLKKEHRITPLKERADKFLRKLKCSSHPDSSITFFCNNHREIICINCKTEEKQDDCEDDITSIDCLYNCASGVKIDIPIAKQKIKEMDCLYGELSRLESIVTVHLQDLRLERNTFLEKLRQLKDKTKRLVESGLERANDKIMNTLLDEEDLVKGMENDNKRILSIFEKQFDQFVELLQTGSREEIFTMQTTIQSNILKYEHIFEKLQEPFNKTSVTDLPNADVLLEEINLTITLIGRENIVPEILVFDNQQAISIGDIDFYTMNASEIVGMVFLPFGEIILCDKSTHMLIMLCKIYSVIGTLKLNEEPSSMAIIDKTKIVVSLPDASCIEIAEIDGTHNFIKGPTKKTKVPCLLISQHDNEIIALVADVLCKCFVKIDTNGNITSPKPIYADEENILETVLFMIVCPVNEIIYITEKTQGCVGISITDGVIVFNYRDTQSPCVTGLATHPSRNIFIAKRGADKIAVIHLADDKHDNQAEKVNDVLSVEGLRPSYIAYSSFRHILFVYSQNILRVFKLI